MTSHGTRACAQHGTYHSLLRTVERTRLLRRAAQRGWLHASHAPRFAAPAAVADGQPPAAAASNPWGEPHRNRQTTLCQQRMHDKAQPLSQRPQQGLGQTQPPSLLQQQRQLTATAGGQQPLQQTTPPHVRPQLRRHMHTNATLQLQPQQQPHNSPVTAYVHMPFCKRRCFYCDFPIAVVGNRVDGPDASARINAYVELVLSELHACAVLNDKPLASVYFGGGTPSLVPPRLVGRVLQELDKKYGVAPGAEVTLEADPGTFDVARLQQYMDVGINRFSVGVQSFQPELLAACGRAHSLEDVWRAVDSLGQAPVSNWSLDLISGLPRLTMDQWRESLEHVMQIQPPHVSVYDLQVEEGTPFARHFEPGEPPLPSNDEAADMYREAVRMLTSAGYRHYEVSNYAQPGSESVHNQAYWFGRQYYAFGMGAASYLQGRRFSRPRRMADYQAWLESFEAASLMGQGGVAERTSGSAATPREPVACESTTAGPSPPLAASGAAAAAAGTGTPPLAASAAVIAAGATRAHDQAAQPPAGVSPAATDLSCSSNGRTQSATDSGMDSVRPGVPGVELPPESEEDRLLEAVMLRLRTAQGLDLRWLAAEFGASTVEAVLAPLVRHEQRGLVMVEREVVGGVPRGEGDSESTRHSMLSSSGAGVDAEAAMSEGQSAGDPHPGHSGGTGCAQENHSGGPGCAQKLVSCDEVHGDSGGEGPALDEAEGMAHGGSAVMQHGQPVHVRLVDPEGFLVSNTIISDVFAIVS